MSPEPRRSVGSRRSLRCPGRAVSAWLATHFPGVNVDQNQLEQMFIAGALIALAPAAQWLHGWQKLETRRLKTETAVQVATLGAVAAAPTRGGLDQEDGSTKATTSTSSPALDDFEEWRIWRSSRTSTSSTTNSWPRTKNRPRVGSLSHVAVIQGLDRGDRPASG